MLCLALFANQYLLRGMIAQFWIWQWLFGSLTIWTPCHHHRPFHLADFKHFISQLLHRVLLSTLTGAKMAYRANYKGHNPFSLMHQRVNHPFSPFTTLSSFSLLLPPPRLPLTKLQYDDIEA